MKNILIIGGSYFVGRVFVEELLKTGEYTIFVLNRGSIPISKEPVSEIVCDRNDLNRMKALLPDLHWCAVIDFCAYTPEDITGTLNALPEGTVDQYIYVSTASVYAHTRDFPIEENAPKLTAPLPEMGPYADYGYQKWLAEVALQDECRRRDIPHTSIRPAFIYGKFNYAPRENYFFDRITNQETIIIPAGVPALFSFVSVWDVAHILMGCIENEASFNRVFNAAAGELISYPRLVEVLEMVTVKKLDVEILDIADINRRQIPLPFPLEEHLIYDGSLAQRSLNFDFTPFVEGMAETYRYYKIGRGLA